MTFKVLIETSYSLTGAGASVAAVIVEFDTLDEAREAVASADQERSFGKTRAVLLNPRNGRASS